MKTTLRLFRWLLLLVISLSATGVWAQTSQTMTQTVCPGSEPYLVTPGNVVNTFLWTISPGTSGVDWTITTPATYSTTVIWANPAVSSTYTLTLTESNPDGCQSIVSVIVTVNPRPDSPFASLTQPTCAVPTGIITVTTPVPGAGISYTVTGTNPVVAPVTNATGVFSGLAPGAYDITTTNSYGCISNPSSVTINAQPSTPAAPLASLTQPTCTTATGAITVTAPIPGAGITYTITGTNPVVGAVTNATGLFLLCTSGIYDVTTTNAVGCSSMATSVTVNAQPPTPATSPIWHN